MGVGDIPDDHLGFTGEGAGLRLLPGLESFLISSPIRDSCINIHNKKEVKPNGSDQTCKRYRQCTQKAGI